MCYKTYSGYTVQNLRGTIPGLAAIRILTESVGALNTMGIPESAVVSSLLYEQRITSGLWIRWIPKRIHTITEFDLLIFPVKEKPTLFIKRQTIRF
jgi:hypothetical protein